jgi:hypothetical protein
MPDTQPLGYISEPMAILHGFRSAFSHFTAFVGHEAATPEGKMVIAMAQGFAAAHGVDPALFDEGGKVVSAAMEFARVLASESAPTPSVTASTLTVSTETTVTEEPTP